MKKTILRALIEVCFIVFLFYSNLLMGEFERTGKGGESGWPAAVADVFTASNLEIAITAALIGYIAFEFLLRKF